MGGSRPPNPPARLPRHAHGGGLRPPQTPPGASPPLHIDKTKKNKRLKGGGRHFRPPLYRCSAWWGSGDVFPCPVMWGASPPRPPGTASRRSRLPPYSPPGRGDAILIGNRTIGNRLPISEIVLQIDRKSIMQIRKSIMLIGKSIMQIPDIGFASPASLICITCKRSSSFCRKRGSNSYWSVSHPYFAYGLNQSE